MKIIDLSGDSINLEKLLNFADRENILVRRGDGTIFWIAAIADDNPDENFAREVELTRQNSELMEFLAARSREPGLYRLEQVRAKLGLE